MGSKIRRVEHENDAPGREDTSRRGAVGNVDTHTRKSARVIYKVSKIVERRQRYMMDYYEKYVVEKGRRMLWRLSCCSNGEHTSRYTSSEKV